MITHLLSDLCPPGRKSAACRAQAQRVSIKDRRGKDVLEAVSPFTCSANVATTQAGLPQMNRRTWSTTWTGGWSLLDG
jgi:hypothetical protein